MRSRRQSYLAGIAAMAAMLFAQAAVALAACDHYRARSQALMIAAQAAERTLCHQQAENGKLCLAHCTAGDQTLDKHQVKVPESIVQSVLVTRGLLTTHTPIRVPARFPAPAAGPPPRILFQSLLN